MIRAFAVLDSLGHRCLSTSRAIALSFAIRLSRAWVRYSPFTIGKAYIVSTFGRHSLSFEARTRSGLLFRGNARDTIQNRLYWFGIWEPQISSSISSFLQPGDVFVDVGANIGYYALLASQIVGPSGAAIAIEPSRHFQGRLREHFSLNRATNILLVPLAAGRSSSRARLFGGPRENLGSTSLLPQSSASAGDSEEVEVEPLSALIPPALLSRVSVIKVDVEGWENDVLLGAEAIFDLLPLRAVIVCEISPTRLAQAGTSAAALLAIMGRHGFRAFRIQNSYDPLSYLNINPPALVELKTAPTELTDVIFARQPPKSP